MKGDPAPAVAAIKQQLRIYSLADAAKPPATNFVNVSGKAFNTIHAMDASFFDEDAVCHNIPLDPVTGRSAIMATFAQFMSMGGQVDVNVIHVVGKARLS